MGRDYRTTGAGDVEVKLIVICPEYEQRGPGTKQALEREVRRAMEKPGGHVNSASGSTAMLAINYCERLGISYTIQAETLMEGGHHRYYVERK